ncbi:MAG: UvrD/REP helicase, partial [Frankiales bacterium]|nr:UvrD/REP helicase [Frankiales bacterium]
MEFVPPEGLSRPVSTTTAPYRLIRSPLPPVVAPQLDEAQRAVVSHSGGPLLVLAGPGTGKTTTLVEAVVERVRRGAAPGAVLVLTFSRKAAAELRERIAGRLARTIAEPSAWTFHAWCLALVTAYDGGGSPRLLSGPERLVRIRELLGGNAAGDGSAAWPARFTEALHTAGMAREVGNLLDRARERGLEPGDVARLAAAAGRDDWAASAEFFAEFSNVLELRREMDYADLVRQALLLLEDPGVLADVRSRYRCVFVDEFQDTDPAQEALLGKLVGRGGDLTVVGDPDQAIYAFRGADVTGILEFRDRFPTLGGERAPVLALGTCRRFGGDILTASRAVARRIPTPGLPVAAVHAHRRLASSAPGHVEVRVFATATDEFTAIADVLRRAHLEDGLPYGRMAVLVRSGVRSVPVARRVLGAAGVPVVTASDDVPVARDPAVTPFLLGLAAAADERELTPDAVRTLLQSPLVGATSAQLRRLGRALRRLDADVNGVAADSATLLAAAIVQPGDLIGVPDGVARPAVRLVTLLA